jgi:hypothetical protein
MSVWTHVAGIIRIDAIRLSDEIPDFDEIIGKECRWESPIEVWNDQEKHPDKYLPMGSEGSLEKSVWINPSTSCMSAYTVSVFGDLRDYETPELIRDWFREKMSESLDTKCSHYNRL